MHKALGLMPQHPLPQTKGFKEDGLLKVVLNTECFKLSES